MLRHAPLPAAILAFAALLPGCARDPGNYPSLAPRAVEKLGFAEPETKPIELKPDPTLDAAIVEKRRELDRIVREFVAATSTSEAQVRAARGRAVGSDPWLDAQTSLAALDDLRAQTSSLATDVDALIQDRAAALVPVYPALATLRSDVQARAASQSETIDRLQAALPGA